MAQGTIVRGDKAQTFVAIRHNIVHGDKVAQGTIVRGDKAQIVIAIRHNIVRGDKAQTVIATNKAQTVIARGDKAQTVIATNKAQTVIARGDKAQTVIATNKAQTVIARGDKAQAPKSCNRHWERIRGWGGVDLHDSHKALAIWCGVDAKAKKCYARKRSIPNHATGIGKGSEGGEGVTYTTAIRHWLSGAAWTQAKKC